MPNSQSIASVVTTAEIALGLSLVFGVLVRPAALIGIALNLLMLAAEVHLGELHIGVYSFLAAALLAFVVGDAGSRWGLDPLLKRFLSAECARRSPAASPGSAREGGESVVQSGPGEA